MFPQSTIKFIIFHALSMVVPWKEHGTTKTHRLGKEGINQRGNRATKGNPEGAAEFHSKDWSVCTYAP